MNTIKSTEHTDFEWAITLNRYTLDILGIWPKREDARQRILANLRSFTSLILIVCVCMIPALHALVKVADDFLAIIDNLQFTLPLLMAMLKLIILWLKKEELLPIIGMIADDWARTKSKAERMVMIRRGLTVRRINKCVYLMMLGCYLLLISFPAFGITFRYLTNVTDQGRPLPVQTYYFYDVKESPYFELTFLAQTISIATAGVSYTAADSFLGLLIFHISGQLENLRHRISDIKRQKDFDYALTVNVRDHVRLIRSVQVIQRTFTLLLLGLLFYFSIFFCLYGFLIISVITRKNKFAVSRVLYLIIIIVTVLGHTCLCCIVGEILAAEIDNLSMLSTKSEEVYNAVCLCEWEELDVKQARALILVMSQASKPLHIKAGNIWPMTMAMFCSLLKMSAGYVSFLLAKID